MRRRRILIVLGLVLPVVVALAILEYVGRDPYAFLYERQPKHYDGPIFAIPRYEYMPTRPDLLIYPANEAPFVLAQIQEELGRKRGYAVRDELAAMGSKPAIEEGWQLLSFTKGADRVEYISAEMANFGFGFQGVDPPQALGMHGCIVMIDHTPTGIEAAWKRIRGLIHL